MRRDLYGELRAWRDHPARKPLLIRGARQVGKTWLLRDFAAREFSHSVYLNFEEEPRLGGLFRSGLSPRAFLDNLELFRNEKIEPGRTLLILDEIQASNDALNSLKYFCEQLPGLHVAGAGSLLGIRLAGAKSFPVGKVEFVDLGPLSFLEFLEATGEEGLRRLIEDAAGFVPYPEALHEKLLDILRRYFFVGGMPEAVRTYVEHRDHQRTQKIQKDILQAYALDFTKYASPVDIPKLSIIWDTIPSQLARENKKFMFSAIRKSARAREYENAVSWLHDAGLILKSFNVSKAKIPLTAYSSAHVFKVYVLDVGLLSAMSDLPASVLVEGNRLFEEFRGALVENFVAQQLVAGGQKRLHYWTSAGGMAEVDFLMEKEGTMFPLEAKSGVNPRSKSLRSFSEQFSGSRLSRANLLNLRCDGSIDNYPLYAIGRFPDLRVALGANAEER